MKLLEREAFLDTLAGYAQDARQGSGRLVLVSGESGMGKTALVEAFQQQLGQARWLWGACDGLLTPRPLGPLFDIGPQAGGELAALCRQGAARDQLFTSFLAELAAPGPLTVVVIEDLHWADEATTDLLSYLGRRLGRRSRPWCWPPTGTRSWPGPPAPGGARRPGHPAVHPADGAAAAVPGRGRGPGRGPRDRAAAHEMDAAELHRITGGNPFYVSEILEAGWPSIPPTVRDAVGARLARATPSARQVAETASVIRGRVELALLTAAVSGVGSPADIDESLVTGLLVADGPAVRFRHELVRMAVEASIPPHRRYRAAQTAAGRARGPGRRRPRGPGPPRRRRGRHRGGRPARTRGGPPFRRPRLPPRSRRPVRAGPAVHPRRRPGRPRRPARGPGRGIRLPGPVGGKRAGAAHRPGPAPCSSAIWRRSGESCACCPPHCGGCAAERNRTRPAPKPSPCWRPCPPGRSWPGPTRTGARTT